MKLYPKSVFKCLFLSTSENLLDVRGLELFICDKMKKQPLNRTESEPEWAEAANDLACYSVSRIYGHTYCTVLWSWMFNVFFFLFHKHRGV